MAEFLAAFIATGHEEGGYANNKNDSGGMTYCGIAYNDHPTLLLWDKLKKYMPLKRGAIVNDPEIVSIVRIFFKQNYWDKVRGDMISSQRIAGFIYDWFVNSGEKAVMRVQEVLNVEQTGFFGDITLGRLEQEIENDEPGLFNRLKARRILFYQQHCALVPKDKVFLPDWIRRVNDLV